MTANPPSTVERAFQLARGGECTSIADIRQALKAERFEMIDAHLSGGSIKKQLQASIATERSAATERV